MKHAARLARLERGLQDKQQRLQGAALALYERGEHRHQVDATCTAVLAGDERATLAAWRDVIDGSPEWRQLWAAYDATWTALEACGRIRHGTA